LAISLSLAVACGLTNKKRQITSRRLPKLNKKIYETVKSKIGTVTKKSSNKKSLKDKHLRKAITKLCANITNNGLEDPKITIPTGPPMNFVQWLQRTADHIEGLKQKRLKTTGKTQVQSKGVF